MDNLRSFVIDLYVVDTEVSGQCSTLYLVNAELLSSIPRGWRRASLNLMLMLMLNVDLYVALTLHRFSPQ